MSRRRYVPIDWNDCDVDIEDAVATEVDRLIGIVHACGIERIDSDQIRQIGYRAHTHIETLHRAAWELAQEDIGAEMADDRIANMVWE